LGWTGRDGQDRLVRHTCCEDAHSRCRAVLLVEQKLPFARRVASEFCILANGRRVAAGAIGELTNQVVRAHLSV